MRDLWIYRRNARLKRPQGRHQAHDRRHHAPRPDSDGEYFGDGVTMGFRRLSIIDIASTGDQPIYNEDRTLVITFNGEIYNYQDLRRELLSAGHTFTTQTDTETILHGFEEWGEHVLDHLRGMFAFAIWNTKTKRLFLARDFFASSPYTTARSTASLSTAARSKASWRCRALRRN